MRGRKIEEQLLWKVKGLISLAASAASAPEDKEGQLARILRCLPEAALSKLGATNTV